MPKGFLAFIICVFWVTRGDTLQVWMHTKHFDFLIFGKTGDKRKKLEEEKGIVIRFVIGHRWVIQLMVDILNVLCIQSMILLLALG